MATTSNTYTGNGSNKLFSITFPYLETSDIDVYLNGTLQTITTQYFFANATTVEFVTAPANGATVKIDRSTDDSDNPATFFPGSSIKAADLNENFDQTLYVVQEINNELDGFITTTNSSINNLSAGKVNKGGDTMAGTLSMGNQRLTDLPTPSLASDAVTLSYVNTAISSSQIAGTTRWVKTIATAGATVSGNDDSGNTLAYISQREQVYLNGACLSRDSDYTATTGTSIVFTVPLLVGDVVQVFSLNNIAVGGNAVDVTFSPSGSGAVPRSTASKLKDVVSVKDFGAVGNASNNDTAALQAAFTYASASGYPIYIPAGTYLITAPLRVGTAGPAVKIYGDGSLHSTIVQQTVGANGIEHDYNPITVAVVGTTCTVTCQYPHNLSSGAISLPLNKGPVSRLPKAFLGPKTITVTSPTVFTFTVAGGTTTPVSQTGFLTPAYARAISIEGIAVKAGQLPGGTANTIGGTAFIVALEGNGPYTSRWNDILVMGWNANGSNGWNGGAVIYGPTGMYWSNVAMLGRNSFANQTPVDCIALVLSTYSSQAAGTSGAVDGAYNSKFFNLELNYWTKAIDLRSEQQEVITADETHGLEGIVFDSVEAGGHNFCSHTNNIWSISKPSQLGLSFKFINCNAELSGNAYAFTGVSNVDITGGTLLMNGGEKGNVPVGEGINYDITKFVNCENVKIDGTEIVVYFTVGQVAGYTGTKGFLFKFDDGTAGMANKACSVINTRWTIQDLGNLDVSGGLYVGSQSQNVKELGSTLVTYTNQGPIFTRQAGAINCFSAAYVNSFVSGNYFATCDSYGNVELRGQEIVTTNASRIAQVTIPAGLFSSINELIQVQMSGTSTADALGYYIPVAMVSGDPNPPTTSSFYIKYAAGLSPSMANATHRISYYISGKA
jgi:hypothetical protein